MDVHFSVVDSASAQQVNINDSFITNLIRAQSPPMLTQLELCLRLKEAQFEVSDLKRGCFAISVMKSAGYQLDSLKAAGFNAVSLKAAGYDAAALKSAGYDFVALKGAGFSDLELTEAGFNIKELKVCSAISSFFLITRFRTHSTFSVAILFSIVRHSLCLNFGYTRFDAIRRLQQQVAWWERGISFSRHRKKTSHSLLTT